MNSARHSGSRSTTSRWDHLTARFSQQRLLVIGDLMLDRYWYGTVNRVSPEAPVVVVSKRDESIVPGGAANAAANITALGGEVSIAGVIGDDLAGDELRRALTTRGITLSGLIQDSTRRTSTKTRIVAHSQHVVRIDDETTAPISAQTAEELIRHVEAVMPAVNAVVLSDYAKGVLTESTAAAVIRIANAYGKKTCVDPKVNDIRRYRGATLIKPNRLELGALTGLPVNNHAETLVAARALLELAGNSAILVTEGADGMTLLEPEREALHFPAHARIVYDVTGAGDTVMAVIAICLAAGAELPDAVELGNRAAGLVVEKVGTEVVPVHELLLSTYEER